MVVFITAALVGLAVVFTGLFWTWLSAKAGIHDDDDSIQIGKKIAINGSPGLIVAALGCCIIFAAVWKGLDLVGEGKIEAVMLEDMEMADDDSAGDDDSAEYK